MFLRSSFPLKSGRPARPRGCREDLPGLRWQAGAHSDARRHRETVPVSLAHSTRPAQTSHTASGRPRKFFNRLSRSGRGRKIASTGTRSAQIRKWAGSGICPGAVSGGKARCAAAGILSRENKLVGPPPHEENSELPTAEPPSVNRIDPSRQATGRILKGRIVPSKDRSAQARTQRD